MKNPFEILGLNEFSSREEVEEQYQKLKEVYSEKRFEVGEEGEEAAEKLQELEVAFQDILSQFERREAKEQFGNIYLEIESLIKKNDLNGAQEKLDNVANRDAEWHYIQSIVFYKRNWFLQSKTQLEFALNMDPDNAKYQESLTKLTKKMASSSIPPEQFRTTQQATPPQGNAGASPCGNGCTGSCCTDLCLADCCCECMGGDLIPCC